VDRANEAIPPFPRLTRPYLYALMLHLLGRTDEAIALQRTVVEEAARLFPMLPVYGQGPQSRSFLVYYRAALAEMLATRDPSAENIADLADPCEQLVQMYRECKWSSRQIYRANTPRLIGRLIELLEAAGRGEEAEAWRAKLAEFKTVRGTD